MQVPPCMKRLLEGLTQELNDFPSDPMLTAQRVLLPKDPDWMKETLAWLDKFMSVERTDREFFELHFSWHSEVGFDQWGDYRLFYAAVREEIAKQLAEFNAKEAKRRRVGVPRTK